MKHHLTTDKFFLKYANLPIDQRFREVNVLKHPGLTMAEIYKIIHEKGMAAGKLQSEIDTYLEIADEYLSAKK